VVIRYSRTAVVVCCQVKILAIVPLVPRSTYASFSRQQTRCFVSREITTRHPSRPPLLDDLGEGIQWGLL
jgi:hypothetical protein